METRHSRIEKTKVLCKEEEKNLEGKTCYCWLGKKRKKQKKEQPPNSETNKKNLATSHI